MAHRKTAGHHDEDDGGGKLLQARAVACTAECSAAQSEPKMIGRYILTISAFLLFALGGAGLFLADEIAKRFLAAAPVGEAFAQFAAAGALGFAIVDWMSRANRIGGIYARPLALGNLLLFTVATTAIARPALAGLLPPVAILLTIALGAMALAFAWLTFAHDPIQTGAA